MVLSSTTLPQNNENVWTHFSVSSPFLYALCISIKKSSFQAMVTVVIFCPVFSSSSDVKILFIKLSTECHPSFIYFYFFLFIYLFIYLFIFEYPILVYLCLQVVHRYLQLHTCCLALYWWSIALNHAYGKRAAKRVITAHDVLIHFFVFVNTC